MMVRMLLFVQLTVLFLICVGIQESQGQQRMGRQWPSQRNRNSGRFRNPFPLGGLRRVRYTPPRVATNRLSRRQSQSRFSRPSQRNIFPRDIYRNNLALMQRNTANRATRGRSIGPNLRRPLSPNMRQNSARFNINIHLRPQDAASRALSSAGQVKDRIRSGDQHFRSVNSVLPTLSPKHWFVKEAPIAPFSDEVQKPGLKPNVIQKNKITDIGGSVKQHETDIVRSSNQVPLGPLIKHDDIIRKTLDIPLHKVYVTLSSQDNPGVLMTEKPDVMNVHDISHVVDKADAIDSSDNVLVQNLHDT